MPVNTDARDSADRLSAPISFRLPEVQRELLDAFAREDRVYQTQILREAFDLYAVERLRRKKVA